LHITTALGRQYAPERGKEMTVMRKDNMDIISLPIELEDNKCNSRYRLVIAAIKRANQLQQGAVPKMTTKAKNVATVAIKEILAGSVSILTGDAAVKAMEEAGKLPYKNVMDEATRKASLPDEPTDLEKEVVEYLRQRDKTDIEVTKY
jgi:DNA-directed RNA polymerase omega subunit